MPDRTRSSLQRSLVQLNPLRSFVEPLAVGGVLGILGFVFAWPAGAVAGGLLLTVLSARVAYDHRDAGRLGLVLSAPFWRWFHAPLWAQRQATGAAMFYIAIWLIVGGLRRVALG